VGRVPGVGGSGVKAKTGTGAMCIGVFSGVTVLCWGGEICGEEGVQYGEALG